MTTTLILDGDDRGAGTALDRAIVALAAELPGATRLRLAGLTLHQCVGCFGCWVQTPGRCRLRDDGAQIVAAAAAAELIVFAAPMRMGFTSALLKRATDRLIPIALPYIDLVDGECHHRLRYGRPLDLALLVEPGDASAEELAATEAVYRRFARNLHGRLRFVRTVAATEVRDALHAA